MPLFGVLLADWLRAGARYTRHSIFDAPAWRPELLLAWLLGFALYHWLHEPPLGPSWWVDIVEETRQPRVGIGASLPSFAAAVLPRRDRCRRHPKTVSGRSLPFVSGTIAPSVAAVTFLETSRRSSLTGRRPSPTSTSKSRTGSSWCSSARRAAARRRRCAWSPASRRSPRATIRIGDRVVNDVPPRDRDIAMVFQSYALYPHLTVYDNIAFGLRLRKMPKAEIDERVQEAARILGLEPLLERKPRALSGGQRQRVAMGRAIVRQPAGVPDGRAALEPRREAARPDARRDRRAPARPRRHDDLRHARPGRGDDDGRPRRRHAQGRAPAGRAARRSSTTARSTSSSAASSAARR